MLATVAGSAANFTNYFAEHAQQTLQLQCQLNSPPLPSKNPELVNFTIRVVNPDRKRDTKTYILRDVQIDKLSTLHALREEILDQLGKHVVSFKLSFDTGYMSGNQQICFTEKDEMVAHLQTLVKNSCQLWCEGLRQHPKQEQRQLATVVIDETSSSDEETRPRKKKKVAKTAALSARDQKAEHIHKLADKLRDKHGDTYNRIQYKLWAEALDVKQYDNMERPPPGSIWGRSTKEAKRATGSQQVSVATTDAMNDAFTTMASSIASALGHSQKMHTPPRPSTPSEKEKVTLEAGVSPGRLADLQGNFFTQLEQLHKLLEHGALNQEEFERRKKVILDRLDELAK